MNNVLIVTMVCLSLATAVSGNSSAGEDAEREAWGEVVDGLRISVVFPKREYGPSEAIGCEVRMQNLVDKEIPVPAFDPIRLFPFVITDSDGKSLVFTRCGTGYFDAAGHNAGTIDGKVVRATIKKGETYVVRIAALNRLFDLTCEGKYGVKVSAKWQYPKGLVAVESKKVTISIEEPENYQMFTETTVRAVEGAETPKDGKSGKERGTGGRPTP